MKPIYIEEVPKKVNVLLSNSTFEMPITLRSKHDSYWEDQKQKKPFLRNGEVFTITKVERSEEELNVFVARSDYKHYLYTINHADTEQPCKVIYTCASVITNDNYIVFGRMSEKTSTPGRLQFSGGGLDISDLEGSRFNLEKNIGAELFEEMGIDIKSSVTKSFFPRFIKQKGTYDFWAVMYELRVNLTANELKGLFKTHYNNLLEKGGNPEFEELLYVYLDKDNIKLFIKEQQSPMVDYLEPILLKYIETRGLLDG